jgi:hypothetical protein
MDRIRSIGFSDHHPLTVRQRPQFIFSLEMSRRDSVTDKIWNMMDPVYLAFSRAFELAVSPEIAPYTAGALLLLVMIVLRMRKTSQAARS